MEDVVEDANNVEGLEDLKEAGEREKRGGRFSIIPAKAVDDQSLSLGALKVLVIMGTYGDREGWCFPSLSTMAKRINVTRPYICKCVKELVSLGYVEVTRRTRKNGSNMSSLYRIIFDGRGSPSVGGDVYPGVNRCLPGGEQVLTGELTLERPTLNAPLERKKTDDFLKSYYKNSGKGKIVRKNANEHLSKFEQWEKESSGIVPAASVISNLMDKISIMPQVHEKV